LKHAGQFSRFSDIEGRIHGVCAGTWKPIGRVVRQHQNGGAMAGPSCKSFHSGNVFTDVVAADVMGALLAQGEALSIHVRDERLAQIFEFEGEGPLALQQEVNRAALLIPERVLQTHFLARVSTANFHGEFVLEIGFRAENWTPSGHVGHKRIDFEQDISPSGWTGNGGRGASKS
jgi:hypothetical protein